MPKRQPTPRLTASELSNLWTSYMNDSMATCVLRYFIENTEDKSISNVLKYALDLAQKHVDVIGEIFQKENQPVPQGFTDNDVDLTAPRLFSDIFYLIYLQNMTRLGLLAYGMALPLSPRKDVYKYYHKCVASTADLSEMVTSVMLEKGVYSRSPYIPTSEQVEYIENQGFMHGWFGKKRPLAGIEVTDIFMCLLTNIFSKVLLTGYAQVAETKEVRDYLDDGKQIASKHTEIFRKVYKNEDLPSPQTWDSEVTTSSVAPFSDKLMMFHSRVLSMGGIATYGGSISTSMRHDLIPLYARLTTELGKYGDQGAEIMIKHKWLEQPPLSASRKKIIERKNT